MRSFLHHKNVSIILALFFFFPFLASANTLGISPSVGVYSVGKTFPVNVYVTSTAQSVNAVSSQINFPTDKLQVVSVSKTSSILSLWVTEPTFSNTAGTINFEGVVPNPGFTGAAGRIVTINFKVVGSGEAPVKFGTSQLLANDGSGTNILKNLNSATFTLNAGSQPVEPPPVVAPIIPADTNPPVTSGNKPPVITSSEYPVQGNWYSQKTGTFSWVLPQDVTATRISVSKQPVSEPTVLYTPAISSKEISNNDDGIWYLHVQLKNASGWSQTAHYMFRVDTTPPENFNVSEVSSSDPTNPTPSFALSATDVISGVKQYSIQIDSMPPIVWQDDGTGVYHSPVLKPGIHTLVAKAFDEALNFSTASINFSINGIDAPLIATYSENITGSSPVMVQGTVNPHNQVRVTLTKTGIDPVSVLVTPDQNGLFNATISGDKLVNGVYILTAVAVDSRGAESEPVGNKTVLVNASWFESLGGGIAQFLAVFVPIVAMLFLLAFVMYSGLGKVRMMKRRVNRELHDVERMVDKAFALLKEDIEDSIHLLERTKNRRKLTEEEAAIIERLRQNLQDAEKVIHKQVRDIEKEIE